MRTLLEIMRGDAGLAKTFWFGGIFGGAAVIIGFQIAAFASTQNIANPIVYSLIPIVFLSFAVGYSLFICTAIFNAASSSGKPGLWGWAARIVAGLAVLPLIYLVLTLLQSGPRTWSDIEASNQIDNKGMPVQIDTGLTLVRLSSNRESKSITYHINVNSETLNKPYFDVVKMRKAFLDQCDLLIKALRDPVEALVYDYKSIDGSKREVQIARKDCGL